MPNIILNNKEGYVKKDNQWLKYTVIEGDVYLDPVSKKEADELDKEFNN